MGHERDIVAITRRTDLIVWQCNGGTNQRWSENFIYRGTELPGLFWFRNIASGQCINATPAGVSAGVDSCDQRRLVGRATDGSRIEPPLDRCAPEINTTRWSCAGEPIEQAVIAMPAQMQRRAVVTKEVDRLTAESRRGAAAY